MTAAQAAKVILDGVREERWRILVGEDAHVIDRLVREAPEEAYEASLIQKLQDAGTFQVEDEIVALLAGGDLQAGDVRDGPPVAR